MKVLVGSGALLLVASLGACADGGGAPSSSGPSTNDPSESTESGGLLAPPHGMRWVGFGDIVVAVPDSWITVSEGCPSPATEAVSLVSHVAAGRCRDKPLGARSLTIAPTDSGVIPTGRGIDLGGEVNGVRVIGSGMRCSASTSGPCAFDFIPMGLEVVFAIRYEGPDAEALVDAVRRSITRLPTGQTTVPPIAFGLSVEEAEKQLTQAGLVTLSPDVNFYPYVTGTRPAAGTVVDVGEDVMLMLGDG